MQGKVTYLAIALVDENFSISGLYELKITKKK